MRVFLDEGKPHRLPAVAAAMVLERSVWSNHGERGKLSSGRGRHRVVLLVVSSGRGGGVAFLTGGRGIGEAHADTPLPP
jgi:hypothetical protein